ncbi:MAG: hypothetical protein HQK89_05845 [Nitrospirae bacterium]|nr:hypothetical protein [Nitrospirota bacterium]
MDALALMPVTTIYQAGHGSPGRPAIVPTLTDRGHSLFKPEASFVRRTTKEKTRTTMARTIPGLARNDEGGGVDGKGLE